MEPKQRDFSTKGQEKTKTRGTGSVLLSPGRIHMCMALTGRMAAQMLRVERDVYTCAWPSQPAWHHRCSVALAECALLGP